MIIEKQTLENLNISKWSVQQCEYICDNLICYLRDKPKAEALACLLAILASELFEKSDFVNNIYKATGYSLDIIGNNFFCERNLRNDDDYRDAILQTLTKLRPMNINDLITFFKNYYNCNQCFYAEENYYNIALYVSFNEEPKDKNFSIMKNIIGAGKHLKIYYTIGNEVISVIDKKEATYAIHLIANDEPVVGNNSFICVSKFTCINVG